MALLAYAMCRWRLSKVLLCRLSGHLGRARQLYYEQWQASSVTMRRGYGGDMTPKETKAAQRIGVGFEATHTAIVA